MYRVKEEFSGFPSQEKVATLLLRNGIRVEDGVAYCNSIRQSDAAIARAAGVDRRVVRSTLERISGTPELGRLFSGLQSMLLMANVAPEIGCTALEIIPTDATIPGILAGITDVMYKGGLSVRQAVVDDPGTRMDSHLIIVVDGQMPSELLPAIKQCRGVSSVILR
ncbi:MAG: regulator of amino acid metabolism, contains ACT domain protein [Candidatus Methanoplasma sp.]|jgi:predicted regulator of amino acid metabolism with ACT domain|nr:regulator of amino acid metabolism, contains ACT domain protein [Candidatus Methanoplasma sp.]